MIATRELLRLHHTRIKFAGYHFFLQSEKERYDGFCGAMRQASFKTNQDNLLLNIDYGQLKEQILKQETTAIFCCNDKLALKVINTLTELGIRVPHDVSIMGFDDWDHAQNSTIGLTTVRQDFDRIGANAAYLLISAINGKVQGNNTKMLSGVSLVRRESTCENSHR